MTSISLQTFKYPQRKGAVSLVFWAVYVLIASYATFWLPYRFPPKQQLVSPSYAFGFNNQVSIIAATLLIGAATLYRLTRSHADSQLQFCRCERSCVSRVLVASILAVYLLFTIVIYLWARSMDRYGFEWESSHFLWRLKLSEIYGLHPYRGYQYEYGPLLAYLPIWFHALLRPFGISDELSYYLLHWLLDAAGICSIVFVLNELTMRPWCRNVIFCALSAAAFLPYMGLSGVVLRFTAPFFGVILIYRLANDPARFRFGRVFLGTVIAGALNIGLSAEIGLAYLIGITVYGVLSLPRKVGFSLLSAVMLVSGLSRALLPTSYYVSLFHFSQGANNLPLLPTSPHLIVYLAGMLWFIPLWLASGLSDRKNRALVCAVCCLCMVLMPGALGRCDPPHVLTYGLGPALFVLASLTNSGRTRFYGAVAVYVAVFVLAFQFINVWVFHLTPRAILAPLRTSQSRDLTNFAALNQYEILALPYGTYGASKSMQNWLWSHQKLAPEYYLGGMGIYTKDQILDRLQDLSRFQYVLTLDRDLTLSKGRDTCAVYEEYIRKAFLHSSALVCKNQALDPDVEISRYLNRNYRVEETLGDYVIWQRLK